MFNKESIGIIKSYLSFIVLIIIIGYCTYFFVTLSYSEIHNSSFSLFEKGCSLFFALVFLCLDAWIILIIIYIMYKALKDLFRKHKTATILIALLIWFTCAQGIFNRIILGPRDNQAMAEVLYKKARKTKEYRIGAICSDGWESSATGRGACSWHGGVKEWLNETETYYSRSFEECKDEAEQMSLLDYYVW
jgi:hypothetical protein